MKKISVLVLIAFCISGCGNEIVCTKDVDQEGLSYTERVELVFDGKELKSADTSEIHRDNFIDSYSCNTMNMVSEDIECKGNVITYKNSYKGDSKNKSDVIKYYKDKGYKCK